MKFKGFKDLIILDIANNHFGDIDHSKKIVSKFSKIVKKNKSYAAIKFQFRHLDTFIHKDKRYLKGNKYVDRFQSTSFSEASFRTLVNLVKKNNLLTASTPFDEKSVDLIEKLDIDIIKIASVSANDFSLLERVSLNSKPKIISTGGLKINEIDKIVSFMSHRGQKFSLMHCISIYPSKDKDLQLKFISNLLDRYPGINIGWSTHENPENFSPSSIAYSLGATIFERHIGLNTKKYPLNKYSSTPEIVNLWLENLNNTKEILGSYNKKISNSETKSLKTLQRGIFAKKNLIKGQLLDSTNIYFSFPLQKKQLSSDQYKNGMVVSNSINKDFPIITNSVVPSKKKNEVFFKELLHEAKAMLNYSNVVIGKDFDLEISHHYGIEHFRKFGAYLFNIINRKYCKKIILMLPEQKHPAQYHKIKDESFHILYGNLTCKLDNKIYKLTKGDILHIRAGQWHEFVGKIKGCIFEEVSTESLKNDSFYKDTKINKLKNYERKTFVSGWGRYELPNPLVKF